MKLVFNFMRVSKVSRNCGEANFVKPCTNFTRTHVICVCLYVCVYVYSGCIYIYILFVAYDL